MYSLLSAYFTNKIIRLLRNGICVFKDSLQQQIHYNGNIFGNKCCLCNEGSLYMTDSRAETIWISMFCMLRNHNTNPVILFVLNFMHHLDFCYANHSYLRVTALADYV